MNRIEKLVIDKLFNRIFVTERTRKELGKLIKVFYNKNLRDIIFVSTILNNNAVYWYTRDHNNQIGYNFNNKCSENLEEFLYFNESERLNKFSDINVIISDSSETIFIKRVYENTKLLDIIHYNTKFRCYRIDLSEHNTYTSFLIGDIGSFIRYNENEYLVISDPIAKLDLDDGLSYENIGSISILHLDAETNSYDIMDVIPTDILRENNLFFGSSLTLDSKSNTILIGVGEDVGNEHELKLSDIENTFKNKSKG